MVANATQAGGVAFDEFWKEYPRRRGSNPKRPAELKFEKLVASGVSAAVMILGARNYAAEQRRDGKDRTQFTAQTITWLNQSRYDDYQQTGDVNGETGTRSGGLVEAGRRLLAKLEDAGRPSGVGGAREETGRIGKVSNGTSNGDVRVLPEGRSG
jgi:hypothetical protein